MESTPIQNFGANIHFTPRTRYEPASADEVLAILDREQGREMRVGGSLHSWSPAAEADDIYLDLRRMNEVTITQDEQGPLATVGGGCQIKRLLKVLASHGLTMPALGLISEQTIAGAISTGTHGSGRPCLSHYISAVHLAHDDPQTKSPRVTVIRGGDDLRAAQCSLGCLGVIVAVELRPRATYQIEERLAFHPTLASVLADEAEWPLHRRETPARRSLLAPLYRLYWFLTIDLGLHLVLLLLVRWLRSPRCVRAFYRYLAPWTLVPGWRVVDRSQDMLIMEHELFRHLEIELFVTRTHLPAAMELARQLVLHCDSGQGLTTEHRQRLANLGLSELLAESAATYTHHYAVCLRRVLADDTLISMSQGGSEDYYALSFITYARPNERGSFYRFADLLARSLGPLFQARCHWGKYCPDTIVLQAGYPEFDRFREICDRFDPQHRFQNAWARKQLFSQS